MVRRIILIALGAVIAGIGGARGQNFEWDIRLDTKFDNHERNSLKLSSARSQTLFSVRAAPAVGLGWHDARGALHRVMAGASLTLDMGARPANRPVEPLLYYNYASPRYSLWAGKFERRHAIGTYSRAMLSGVAAFYDNVVDGFAMQLHSSASKLELVLDWDGMASSTERESFRINSALETSPFRRGAFSWLWAGYSFDMYHLASRSGAGDGVVDHISASPWIGARLEWLLPWFESLTLQAGWLQSLDRDRAGDNRWLTPGGVTLDAGIQKWRVGIANRFYRGMTGPEGGTQMPLWYLYGNRVYRGDPIFASTASYNYTRIYWLPRLAPGVDLTLELGLHTAGGRVGWQQVIWVGVTLDNNFFKRKK
jgi:hypothetical protein